MENTIAGIQPSIDCQNIQTSENNSVKNTKEIKVFNQNNNNECDTVDISTKKEEVSGGNKFLSGAASFVIPGLGQLINGEGKKGLKYFLKQLGCETGAITLGTVALSLKGTEKGGKAGKIVAGIGAAALGIGAIVNDIKSTVDAAKNAKNK